MKKDWSYFLVLTLLFFSGNPLVTFLFGKFSTIIGLLLIFVLLNTKIKLDKNFLNIFKFVVIGLFLIGLFQYFEFEYVSVLGMFNLMLKFLLGGIVINNLKGRFNWIFFNVASDLCLISLFFYLPVNILQVSLPSIDLGDYHVSYIIYTAIFNDDIVRNCGMFWEPGAFAGVLTLCLALNFNNLNYYWINYRYKLLFILLALLTSQSTTGYLVGSIIFLFIFINGKNFFAIPLFLIAFIYIYQTNEFLSKKIESQFKSSQDQSVGEFSNTRFGSAIFDWNYILKHPLIGNGLDEKTRYSDHQYLFYAKENEGIGSGNGFTGTLASLGVFYIFVYFYFLWKATIRQNKSYAFLLLIVVLLNLQGEQWFNFPLYLGLPFLVVKPIILKRKIIFKYRFPQNSLQF